jgi:trans-aconitate methyltransferase
MRALRPATSAEGWNHNTHYHECLLSLAPRPCQRALDVGCGLGAFARRLANVAGQVDAIDREPAVVSLARTFSTGVDNVRFIEADFLTWQAEASYDFVSMIATLHHLPFAEGLTRAAALLQPGGVLAVLGLDRANSWFHAGARSAIAYPVSGYYRLTRRTSRVGAPIQDPSMTLDDIRRDAIRVLPGVTIERRLLWRYVLHWMKPARENTKEAELADFLIST